MRTGSALFYRCLSHTAQWKQNLPQIPTLTIFHFKIQSQEKDRKKTRLDEKLSLNNLSSFKHSTVQRGPRCALQLFSRSFAHPRSTWAAASGCRSSSLLADTNLERPKSYSFNLELRAFSFILAVFTLRVLQAAAAAAAL